MPVQLADQVVQKFGVAAHRVPDWVFRRGLPPMKRPLAWLLRPFAARAFSHDRLVVEEFCRATSREQVKDAVNLLHRAPAYEHAFVRHTLGCRISGRRLTALADEVFAASAG